MFNYIKRIISAMRGTAENWEATERHSREVREASQRCRDVLLGEVAGEVEGVASAKELTASTEPPTREMPAVGTSSAGKGDGPANGKARKGVRAS